MDKALLKQKLHDYIDTTDIKKLKALYTIFENEIDEVYDWRKDKEFVAELDRREQDFLDGKTKTYTLEESMNRVKNAVKTPVIAK